MNANVLGVLAFKPRRSQGIKQVTNKTNQPIGHIRSVVQNNSGHRATCTLGAITRPHTLMNNTATHVKVLRVLALKPQIKAASSY
jgi:hypothetical protein